MSEKILEVNNLSVVLRNKKTDKEILTGVSFQLRKGQCLGILGESGSGKSICAKAVMGLLDDQFKVSGEIWYKNENLLQLSKEKRRSLRGKEMAMILQNPMTCFDPLYRVADQIAETYETHMAIDKNKINAYAVRTLEKMLIRNPDDVLRKYPHQLSGGMLQRIMIGLALSMAPEVLVADEPTTAIDAVTQYEIMREFEKIKQSGNTAMIFITHDLSVVSQIADYILVMNQGQVVDRGSYEHITKHASDLYTKRLIKNRLAVINKYREVLGI
ncbi:MAG: nickel transport system ATP-binding protein [Acetobacterium sp.]|nr:nickel transport system ATP-binding protein [Acetobacterium sp.]